MAERPPLPSCDNFCFCLKPLPAFVLRLFCERSRFFFMALSASPSPWPDACERCGASVSWVRRVNFCVRTERAAAAAAAARQRLGWRGGG